MSKTLITKIVQYLLFLGLGLLFAWLSFRNMNAENWIELKNAAKGARLWVGIPVFFMLVGSHWIRALRWKLLIEPLGYSPGKINSFLAVLVGYLVNLGIPRLGEIAKCTVLARYEKIPADKLIGTIILERLIDALCLIIVFAITLAVQPGLYGSITQTFFPNQVASSKTENSSPLLLLLLVLSTTVILFVWLRYKKQNLLQFRKQLMMIFQRVLDGITAIRHLKKRKQFMVLTVILWSLYLFAGYLGFLTFKGTASYGFREALTILSAGSIGMIASPGGIGAYAYLVQNTMQLYGLNYTLALAFGWLLWLAQTAVIVLGGILSFVALPWFNTTKKHQ